MVRIQKEILELGQAPFSDCLARVVRTVDQYGLAASSAHFLEPPKDYSLVQWTHNGKTGKIEYAVTIGRTVTAGTRYSHQHALIRVFQPNDHSVSFHIEPSEQIGPCPLRQLSDSYVLSDLEPGEEEAVFRILARVPKALPDRTPAPLDSSMRQDHDAKISKLNQLNSYRIASRVYPELIAWLDSLQKPKRS